MKHATRKTHDTWLRWWLVYARINDIKCPFAADSREKRCLEAHTNHSIRQSDWWRKVFSWNWRRSRVSHKCSCVSTKCQEHIKVSRKRAEWGKWSRKLAEKRAPFVSLSLFDFLWLPVNFTCHPSVRLSVKWAHVYHYSTNECTSNVVPRNSDVKETQRQGKQGKEKRVVQVITTHPHLSFFVCFCRLVCVSSIYSSVMLNAPLSSRQVVKTKTLAPPHPPSPSRHW